VSTAEITTAQTANIDAARAFLASLGDRQIPSAADRSPVGAVAARWGCRSTWTPNGNPTGLSVQVREAGTEIDRRATDPSSCPNCGAPTGGLPCTTSFSGGPSCADVLTEGMRHW